MTETAPPQTNGASRRRRAPAATTAPKTDTAAEAERFAAPPKLRRKPMLVAVAVITITLGALLAAYLTTVVGHTKPVVAVRNDIARGQTISQSDLMVVQITPDPALKTVPGDQLLALVGKHASIDLPAGGLVTTTATTDATIPAVGQSLVGVSLTPAQLPGEALRPGMKVRIVNTPRQQDDPPAKPPAAVPATVVTTHAFGDQGQVVVDVTVPQKAAAALAAAIATGRVVLIVDGAS